MGPEWLHKAAEWWRGLDDLQKQGVGLGAILFAGFFFYVALATAMHPSWQPIALVCTSVLIVFCAAGLAFTLSKKERRIAATLCMLFIAGAVAAVSDYAVLKPAEADKIAANEGATPTPTPSFTPSPKPTRTPRGPSSIVSTAPPRIVYLPTMLPAPMTHPTVTPRPTPTLLTPGKT